MISELPQGLRTQPSKLSDRLLYSQAIWNDRDSIPKECDIPTNHGNYIIEWYSTLGEYPKCYQENNSTCYGRATGTWNRQVSA